MAGGDVQLRPGAEMNPDDALLVDLYELTMAAAYFEHRIECRATFELFVRQLPVQRSYLVAAGLDAALGYLENLRFSEADVRFLRTHPAFRTVTPSFFDYLRGFRFHGDVQAVEEGTLIFAEEPLLRVSAPVLEAQIVETYLLSVIHFETLVASKAARVVHAAEGRPVLEFGTRRAHGPEAGVRAARAACVGGCTATSNVLAGALYDLPLAGTAAHSWTQVFPSERRSFEALLETFPDSAILLVDTYDVLAGAEIAATLGKRVPGVRLDSGDLLEKSRLVRAILDRHGLGQPSDDFLDAAQTLHGNALLVPKDRKTTTEARGQGEVRAAAQCPREHRAQVVAVRCQCVERIRDVTAPVPVIRGARERGEMLGVTASEDIHFAGLIEPLERVLSSGLEHSVTPVAPERLGNDERLVHQRLQRVERIPRIEGAVSDHVLQRIEIEPAGEHAATPDDGALALVEQLVAPVQHPA